MFSNNVPNATPAANQSNRSKRRRIADGDPNGPPVQAPRHEPPANENSPRSHTLAYIAITRYVTATFRFLVRGLRMTNSVFGGELPSWQRHDGEMDEEWDGIPWKISKRGTSYINALVGKDHRVIDCENGLCVWNLDLSGVPPLFHMANDDEDLSLFVSTGTRGCYDEVAEMLVAPSTAGRKSRFLVIGNPGIGKSRSIMYLVRKLLRARHASGTLHHNTLVAVIEDQETGAIRGIAWCCDGAGNGCWRVCHCHRSDFRDSTCGGLYSKETVYIVDGANRSAATEPTGVTARTVYVCSPNRAHYNQFKKNCHTFLVPMWELKELIGAHENGLGDRQLTFNGKTAADSNCGSPAAQEQFHREVIEYRYDHVGGAVRYVLLDAANFTKRLSEVEDGFNKLTVNDLVPGVFSPLADPPHATLPGTFIRFVPDSRDGSFLYGREEDPQTAGSLKGIRGTKYLCPYVVNEFFTKCHRVITTTFNSCEPYKKACLGHLFEQVVILGMERAAQRTATHAPLFPRATRSNTVPSTATASSAAVLRVSLGCTRAPCPSLNPLDDLFGLPLVESLGHLNAPRRLIVPAKHTHPLFDFADARNRVYQCTISQKNHSYDAEYLLRMLFVANCEDMSLSGSQVVIRKKFDFCRQHISDTRSSVQTFRTVTQYICALLGGIARTKTQRPVHFVWVVPHSESIQQATYHEPTTNVSEGNFFLLVARF